MKKKLIINSEICDARKIKEEHYADYEQISLNTEILLLNEYSKAVFHRLPITVNAENILELDGDEALSTINGNFEIAGDISVQKNAILLVNGNLHIGQGTKEILEKYKFIHVNGNVKCPKSMSAYLGTIQINGVLVIIPDDCVELKDDFEMDAYFPIRAKENGKYFAYKSVKILDSEIDVQTLKAKKLHFDTKKLLTRQELLKDVIDLVDENTELQVVPAGYAYIKGDVSLNESLIAKYGMKLYVDGSLILDRDSTPWIEKIEELQVSGDVSMLSTQVEAFQKLDAKYRELVIVKGKMVKNIPMISIDTKMLELSEDGVTVKNCAQIKIKKEVSSEMILEKLQIMNCALVSCSQEQESAIKMVGKNIAKISSEEEAGVGEALKKMAESKMINAENYSL
ncbi:MAG: hypothetical protein Q4B90_06105 [Eubacteriales bacterium]|nr:hypothetical protein [Eubacteriales bacterium]